MSPQMESDLHTLLLKVRVWPEAFIQLDCLLVTWLPCHLTVTWLSPDQRRFLQCYHGWVTFQRPGDSVLQTTPSKGMYMLVYIMEPTPAGRVDTFRDKHFSH